MGRKKRKIDMLSGLPDDILHHILSFLPTKTSVCTSVLAKRWRFLWTHVPNLEFDENDFRGGSGEANPLDIINRVIMLHEAKIVNTFSFRLSKVKGRVFPMETLINYLIKRGVRNLSLAFYFKYLRDIVCTVPNLIFTCKTLVDLTLDFCGLIPYNEELFLPNLKKLNLSYVQYESDQSLPHLLSGCPLLEELTIRDYFREGQKNSGCIIVSSPTVKKLTVDFTYGGGGHDLEEKLILDVPALIYLKLFGCDLERVRSLRKIMTSLLEADIFLNGCRHMCDLDCNEHGFSIEFLSCLCHVKYLKITNECDDLLLHYVGTGSMVKFVNLTNLELDLSVNWHNVVKFLKVADNLEVLIINLSQMLHYTEPKRVPLCILSRLKTVTLTYFDANDDCDDAFETVKYILKNAQVLKRMEIYPIDNHFEKGILLDALRRISLFERGSKSCQVAFNTD